MMACPKCGCKTVYQFDDEDEPSDDRLQRCAACGEVFDLDDHSEEDDMDDLTEQEREKFAALMTEARLKLREAEQAWYAAFGAAPLGEQRIMAAAVYERIRCATRRPF
jgi:predicted Zn finger-like uncharacterized protein